MFHDNSQTVLIIDSNHGCSSIKAFCAFALRELFADQAVNWPGIGRSVPIFVKSGRLLDSRLNRHLIPAVSGENGNPRFYHCGGERLVSRRCRGGGFRF
jgi:hypothetical protein